MILGKPMFSLTPPEHKPRVTAAVAAPEPQVDERLASEPKKARKPRAKKPKPPAPPADPTKPRTADIAKIRNYYLHNVRMQDTCEYQGIFRQILLMCQKGITMAMISQAVQNYEKDPFTRASMPQKRHSIRKFMMPERIKQWASATNSQVVDKSLTTLDRLTQDAIANQTPAAPLPTWKPELEEEDDVCHEL